jgi:hypothetical protein
MPIPALSAAAATHVAARVDRTDRDAAARRQADRHEQSQHRPGHVPILNEGMRMGGGRVRIVANVISSLQRQRSRSTRSPTSRHKTEATNATKLTMKVTAQPARICRMGLRQTCAKTTSRSAIRSSRHLEGANITAVSSKAAPVHMDSDTTIEVFIPAFWPVRIVAPRRALHRMTGLGIDLIMGIPGAHRAIDAHGRLRQQTRRAAHPSSVLLRLLEGGDDEQEWGRFGVKAWHSPNRRHSLRYSSGGPGRRRRVACARISLLRFAL